MHFLFLPLLLQLSTPTPSGAMNVQGKALLLESHTLEEKNEIAKAAEKISEALKGNEGDYFLNFRLASLRAREKKHKDAITHYLKAASIAPRSLEPLLELSQLQYNLGSFTDAATTCLKLLALDPANHTALTRVVASYTKQKLYKEALVHAVNASRFYPSDPVILEQRGFLEVTLKKKESKETLNQLLLVSPKNIYARSILGESL